MVDGVSLIFFEIDFMQTHKIPTRCQAYFNLCFSSADKFYILNTFKNYVFNT